MTMEERNKVINIDTLKSIYEDLLLIISKECSIAILLAIEAPLEEEFKTNKKSYIEDRNYICNILYQFVRFKNEYLDHWDVIDMIEEYINDS